MHQGSQYKPSDTIVGYTTDYSGYRHALASSFPMDKLPNYQQWTCGQWIDFHERLKARYGKTNANLVWNEYWNNKPHGWLGDKCIGVPDFVSYFKRQGVEFNPNFYSYVTEAQGFLSSIPQNMRILAIAGLVVGGVLLVGFVSYQVYNAITMRNIVHGGLKKAANNPELVGKGIGAGLRGGV